MYEFLLSLSALLCGSDARALASDSFANREAAQARLASAGCLAWPVLARASHSADPEARHRARALLEAPRERLARLTSLTHAVWLVRGPVDDEAEQLRLIHDGGPELLDALVRYADRAGLLAEGDWRPDDFEETQVLYFLSVLRRKARS